MPADASSGSCLLFVRCSVRLSMSCDSCWAEIFLLHGKGSLTHNSGTLTNSQRPWIWASVKVGFIFISLRAPNFTQPVLCRPTPLWRCQGWSKTGPGAVIIINPERIANCWHFHFATNVMCTNFLIIFADFSCLRWKYGRKQKEKPIKYGTYWTNFSQFPSSLGNAKCI